MDQRCHTLVLQSNSIFFNPCKGKFRYKYTTFKMFGNHPALDASRVDFGIIFFLKNSDNLWVVARPRSRQWR